MNQQKMGYTLFLHFCRKGYYNENYDQIGEYMKNYDKTNRAKKNVHEKKRRLISNLN